MTTVSLGNGHRQRANANRYELGQCTSRTACYACIVTAVAQTSTVRLALRLGAAFIVGLSIPIVSVYYGGWTYLALSPIGYYVFCYILHFRLRQPMRSKRRPDSHESIPTRSIPLTGKVILAWLLLLPVMMYIFVHLNVFKVGFPHCSRCL
jgi:hypothetical protein